MNFQGYRVLQKEREYEGLQIFRAVVEGGDRHVQIRVFPTVLSRFPLLMQQFRTTFNKLSQVRHNGICPIISLNAQASQCYAVLPYVVAGSLADRFRSGFHSGLDVSQVINEIAVSLDYAHRNGLIHGNMTSENVLIDEEGHAQIVGFGEAAILRALPSSGDHDKRKMASVGPPEAEIASKLSPATDQYSLALIALRLLTGLSTEEAFETLVSDIVKVQPRASREGKYSLDLSAQVLQVLNRALTEKPSKRFASVLEFNQALQIALGVVKPTQPTPIQPGVPVIEEQKPQRKKRAVLIAPILTGIAIFGAVITVVAVKRVDSNVPVEPTETSGVGTYSVIELPDENVDQHENSGLTRDPTSLETTQPSGFGGIGKSSPTPTVGSSGEPAQSTSPPQPSRTPPSNPPTSISPSSTVTSIPIPTGTPVPTGTPGPTATPTSTGIGPTATSQPSSTPVAPPPPQEPTINPPACKSNPNHRNYCTPTPPSPLRHAVRMSIAPRPKYRSKGQRKDVLSSTSYCKGEGGMMDGFECT